ncbi:hypothetical protein, partial [Frankia sp. CcWB2]
PPPGRVSPSTRGRPPRPPWPEDITTDGNGKPATNRSRPTCAARDGVLRSTHPDTVYQEIYGYLLTVPAPGRAA